MTPDRRDEAPDHAAVRPPSLAGFGALIGDPVRAAILLQLSDGSRRPAGELASLAGASPQAASAHLARLVEGGLLAVERHGRHRFFSIASGEAAEMIETLSDWVDQPVRRPRHDPSLRRARLCYDHLAGELGVAVLDRVTERGLLVLGRDGPGLSEAGVDWCARHGVDAAVPARSRRPQVRLCLDWTQRRPHLGGHVGAALARMMLDAGYLLRGSHRRTLDVSARGRAFLRGELGVDLDRRECAGAAGSR